MAHDRDRLRAFEDGTLPFEEWTHAMHVKIAYLYLRDHPFEVALSRLRDGIRAYNAVHDVPEGPQSGYNETTTHALAHLICATLHAYGRVFPTPDADAFYDTHPQLWSKHILRLFYSPERRMDPEAKTRFVEPDLASLPRIVDP